MLRFKGIPPTHSKRRSELKKNRLVLWKSQLPHSPMPGQVMWVKLLPPVCFSFLLCEVTRSPYLTSKATSSPHSDAVLSSEAEPCQLSGQPHEEAANFSSLPDSSISSQNSSRKQTFALFSKSWFLLLSTKTSKNLDHHRRWGEEGYQGQLHF